MTNVPNLCIDYMNRIFHNFLHKFVIVFIDDILIYSKTHEEHEEHLRIVLDILRDEELYVKLSKCEVLLKEVNLLGYVISNQGILVDLIKVETML